MPNCGNAVPKLLKIVICSPHLLRLWPPLLYTFYWRFTDSKHVFSKWLQQLLCKCYVSKIKWHLSVLYSAYELDTCPRYFFQSGSSSEISNSLYPWFLRLRETSMSVRPQWRSVPNWLAMSWYDRLDASAIVRFRIMTVPLAFWKISNNLTIEIQSALFYLSWTIDSLAGLQNITRKYCEFINTCNCLTTQSAKSLDSLIWGNMQFVHYHTQRWHGIKLNRLRSKLWAAGQIKNRTNWMKKTNVWQFECGFKHWENPPPPKRNPENMYNQFTTPTPPTRLYMWQSVQFIPSVS